MVSRVSGQWFQDLETSYGMSVELEASDGALFDKQAKGTAKRSTA